MKVGLYETIVSLLRKVRRHRISWAGSAIVVFILERHFLDLQPLDAVWAGLTAALFALANNDLAHIIFALVGLYLLWRGADRAVREERRLAEQTQNHVTETAAELAKPVADLLERYDRRLVALQDYVMLQERLRTIQRLLEANRRFHDEIRGFVEAEVKPVPADDHRPMARDHIETLFRKISEWHMEVRGGLTTQDWISETDKGAIDVVPATTDLSGRDEAENLQGSDRARYAAWIVQQERLSRLLDAKARETLAQTETADRIIRQG